MRDLNKSQLGLGKVRNRITPSIEEFSVLELKYQSLIQETTLSGNLSSLPQQNPNKVSYDAVTQIYTIDLDNVKTVKILMNEDGKTLSLVGGPQGKPIFFEIENPGSFNLFWRNLRAENGSTPSLSITTTGGVISKTIIEVVKLGNFYYMIGVYRDEPVYTLDDLVNDLNFTFDRENSRIIGQVGILTERFVIGDAGSEIVTLGSITLFDNDDYIQSGYAFILDIPQDIMDNFYPNFIKPVIDKLETDTSKYFINTI